MAELPATANGDKAGQNASKTIRDKVCAHLKKLMDKVREVGKYLFWLAKSEPVQGIFKPVLAETQPKQQQRGRSLPGQATFLP